MTGFKAAVSTLTMGCALAMAPASMAETFQEALISVYNSNPRLMAERARVREVDETYVQARAQGRFSASAAGSFDATTTRSSFLGGGPSANLSGFPKSAQIQIIQPLYQGGRVKALKRQAKSSILAAREALRSAEQELMLSAANAYIDVVRDEETARIRRNNVRVLARQGVAAQDRFDVGAGTRTDIAQAQSRLAQAEAGLAQADAQLQASRATYKRIIGHPPVDLQSIPIFELPNSLPTAIGLARQNNPQLLAAYFNEQAAGSAIDVAKSASRPVVSLNGSVGALRDQVSSLSEADQASIAAQVSIPIFSGGLNKSRVRQAKHAKTRLGFEVRDAELAIDQSVAQLWAQLDAARRALVSSQKQVEAAQIAFEGVDLEQKVGTRTTLDVLDAEQEVLNAKLAVENSQHGVNAAVFQLLTVLGVFDADGIRLPVEAYDPADNFKDISSDKMKALVDKFVPERLRGGDSDPEIVPDDMPVAMRVPAPDVPEN